MKKLFIFVALVALSTAPLFSCRGAWCCLCRCSSKAEREKLLQQSVTSASTVGSDQEALDDEPRYSLVKISGHTTESALTSEEWKAALEGFSHTASILSGELQLSSSGEMKYFADEVLGVQIILVDRDFAEALAKTSPTGDQASFRFAYKDKLILFINCSEEHVTAIAKASGDVSGFSATNKLNRYIVIRNAESTGLPDASCYKNGSLLDSYTKAFALSPKKPSRRAPTDDANSIIFLQSRVLEMIGKLATD